MSTFQRFSPLTLKFVRSGFFDRWRKFSDEEMHFLLDDKQTRCYAIDLRESEKDEGPYIGLSEYVYNSMTHVDRDMGWLHNSWRKGEIPRDVYLVHKGILTRLLYQLDRAYGRTERLAVLEMRAKM